MFSGKNTIVPAYLANGLELHYAQRCDFASEVIYSMRFLHKCTRAFMPVKFSSQSST